jgi:hypothetical protein
MNQLRLGASSNLRLLRAQMKRHVMLSCYLLLLVIDNTSTIIAGLGNQMSTGYTQGVLFMIGFSGK